MLLDVERTIVGFTFYLFTALEVDEPVPFFVPGRDGIDANDRGGLGLAIVDNARIPLDDLTHVELARFDMRELFVAKYDAPGTVIHKEEAGRNKIDNRGAFLRPSDFRFDFPLHLAADDEPILENDEIAARAGKADQDTSDGCEENKDADDANR